MATSTRSDYIRHIPQTMARVLLISLAWACFSETTAWADSWPREFAWSGGSMQVFKPEIDTVKPNTKTGSGSTIEARAALSIRQNGRQVPMFAAIRFKADTFSQSDATILSVENIRVIDIRFGKQEKNNQKQLIALVENSLANITLNIEAQGHATNKDSQDIKADPPRIILSSKPAILVFIDGEPRVEAIKNSRLRRVVNTPFSIIVKQNIYYLAASKTLWYRANQALGPWTTVDNAAFDVPPDVQALVKSGQEPDQESTVPPAYPRPDIIVATEPTELIIYDGIPSWSPLQGMSLLYMSNTDNDVFLDIQSSQNYVLLGGRWYKGRVGASDIPWQAVANDALPTAFQNIEDYLRAPEVMTHIAGTRQSRDALLDNTLPRTTSIDRNESNFAAEWDGNPRFKEVRGTRNLQYALNTPDAIFKYQNRYYACEEGVWYTSDSPWGSWSTATRIPNIIYDIPASNPHYNVTYVRVYGSTPQSVYVGYTPGYLGSYAYHGSVVYGTGWRYRPWANHNYYARPTTWGFDPYYDARNGWGHSNNIFNTGYSFAHTSRYPSYGFHGYQDNSDSFYRDRSGHNGYRRHNSDNVFSRQHLSNRNRLDYDTGYEHLNGKDRTRDYNRGKPQRLANTRPVSRAKHKIIASDRSQNRRQSTSRRNVVKPSENRSQNNPGKHRVKSALAPAGLRNVNKRQLAKIRVNVRKEQVGRRVR